MITQPVLLTEFQDLQLHHFYPVRPENPVVSCTIFLQDSQYQKSSEKKVLR